ncbi:MAG: bifunctional 2-polyprenyl-6-hydroxyphenol methylase/3-demethylubiquinol 3-O-methyltransferase UbiG [Methylococcaceae bacterium]|nr:bifunctional 2-polyprenyl-6-hydroxyphenol methylase/3-demethylubiquinol 3-O-methyltransferase UbiG [Methylococcaceae bacterium]MCI0668688.1 bifunctional 2-polyprenyl-6-hydroxyphenol methylase/3-demethylubiquinol 3-O-methyltransferase UbiG [Methylococcaceae bacterium]MCI0732199.1 bifunctional 2-polyprenyl-6-hydroxyphenol methylase/3-demethylubiquinol 3-O-methyltransferase UbiG [Methylococcaceae bacterium]
MAQTENVYPHEIDKFGSLAERWWDLDGEFKTLHAVNPLRIRFISERSAIEGRKILDVGCGGGILSEALAKLGARVTGIDLSADLIEIAELHGLESGLKVEYKKISAEALAAAEPESFDGITCMEMLEHVPEPESIVAACSVLLKPGGKVFFSTLNRKPKSYLMAVVGAETILRIIPKGTHDYKAFIKPSELSAWCRRSRLEIEAITGIEYNPLSQSFSLGRDIDVNYLAVFEKN